MSEYASISCRDPLLIAIIDDNAADLVSLKQLLDAEPPRRFHSFEIRSFESGEAFLASADTHPYTLILIDIYMNGMTGVETIRRLRKQNATASVVFLTSSTQHYPDAFSVHAFDYIVKPLTAEALARLLSVR